MTDLFGTFKKRRKSNVPSGSTSPRSSMDDASRHSLDDPHLQEPMPDSDEVIDELFENMLARRGLDEEKRKPLLEKIDRRGKWAMIVQDRKAEQVVSGRTHDEVQPLLTILSDLAGDMWNATRDSTARAVERHAYRNSHLTPIAKVIQTNNPTSILSFEATASDRNSPEYYIRKFMETDLRAVTPVLADNLAVSLRTRPLDWVIRFTDLKGLKVICNGLSYLNRKPDSERKGQTLELEYGLIKCIKVLVNARWGAREAILNPEYIHSMVFSITCPQWQGRKIIYDILLFLSHCDVPLGHQIVMQGLELFRKHHKDFSMFDTWLRNFDQTLDGTKKMGRSDSTDDFYKLNIFNPPDSHLVEYCLSNLSLINALAYIPTEVADRVYLRSQLKTSGLERIFKKLETLEDPLLDDQIEKYKRRAEDDIDEEFGDDLSMYNDISIPNELLDLILESISDAPNALNYLLQTFRSMLLIKGDPERKTQYHQAISIVTSNIVMDRRDTSTAEELGASAYGLSVNSMVKKFNELDRLQDLASSAEQDRELALRLQAENKHLMEENELLKGMTDEEYQTAQKSYKAENMFLRALLKKSKQTIETLQNRLNEKSDILDDQSLDGISSSLDPPKSKLDNTTSSDYRMPPISMPELHDYHNLSTPTIYGQNQPYPVHHYHQSQSPQTFPYPPQTNMSDTNFPLPSHAGGFVIPGSIPQTSYNYHNTSPLHHIPSIHSQDYNHLGSPHIIPNPYSPGITMPLPPQKSEIPYPISNETTSPDLNTPSSSGQEHPTEEQSDDPSEEAPEMSDNPSSPSLNVSNHSLEDIPDDSEIQSLEEHVLPSSEESSVPPPPPPPPSGPGIPPPPPPPPGGPGIPPPPPPPPGGPGIPPPPPPPPGGPGIPPPPPPPPGGPGIPPPPPPPPGGPGIPPPPGAPPPPGGPMLPPVPAGPLRKQLRHYPQTKLKNLQWQKLEARNVVNTIWELKEVNEDEIEDALDQHGVFEKLEDLFPAKVNQFLERRLKAKVEEKKDAIKFLNKDKSKSINIAILPKIKSYPNFERVRLDIMRFNDGLCTEIFLSNLIAFMPGNKDDLNLMDKYLKGPPEACEELDIPEQFMVEMYRMYRYQARIPFMLFRVQFWEKFEHLEKNMTIILNTSEALKSSVSLKEVLCLILVVGNFMNDKSFQGGAFGMRVSSINKLVDTKASNISTINLLHVVAGSVRRQFPKLLQFLNDLKEIEVAARIMSSYNDMGQQYKDMRQGLKDLELELKAHWQPEDVEIDDEQDRFRAVMTQYYEEAATRFEDLRLLYVNMEVGWKDVVRYYGENPDSMRPDDFFSAFSNFVLAWKKAELEELKIQQRQEREEKRKRDEFERKERARIRKERAEAELQEERDSIQDINTESDNKGESDRCMMDNMLEKLRNGDLEVKTTRRRSKKRHEDQADSSDISATALLESLALDD